MIVNNEQNELNSQEYNRESEDDNIEDEASKDDTVIPERYDITSFGADYDVEGLVNRLKREDILVPSFQRSYVWNLKMASRFIESLLLGLPVPGIFLARDSKTNKLIVIDGQQRLKSLLFFYDGYFNPKSDGKTKRVFKLEQVQKQLVDRTYDTLDKKDRIKLNDAILHATIVKQNSPPDDDTSMYHIFERLNNGGLKLAAQEIRTAVSDRNLIDVLSKLNDYHCWRTIYGAKSHRLKDEEIILRFLAMYYKGDKYERPMKEFLNKFAKSKGVGETEFLLNLQRVFIQCIDLFLQEIGTKVFRPQNALNVAVFDSMMVGLARRLDKGAITDLSKIKDVYKKLMNDKRYKDLISQHTSDDANVSERLLVATTEFDTL